MKTLPPVLIAFLDYTSIDTHCIETKPGETPKLPSSEGQTELIGLLYRQLEELGVSRPCMSKLGDGSLMVELPATEGCENAPHVVLGAHVDTYPGQSGEVCPILHEPYMGGDLTLPSKGTVIPASDLSGLEGKAIVTSSGDTLLGGDDKAGVAEIMVALPTILANPHGPLTIIFFTDEELGEASFVQFLDPAKIATWDIFYTLDGLEAGTIDIGCFNGGKVVVKFEGMDAPDVGGEVVVKFEGTDAHPGVGGKKIKSALAAATHFCHNITTFWPQPWHFDANEPAGSFIHVTNITGNVGEATATLIPRSFDLEELTGTFYTTISQQAEESAKFFDLPGFEVGSMVIQYQSTEEPLKRHPCHITTAKVAIEAAGLKSITRRVRGGTDGAMLNLTFPNVPCINLGTGDRNCHQITEFVVVEEMEAMAGVIISLIAAYANRNKTEF